MIQGMNHLTLTVSDLDKSLKFYSSLGFKAEAKWNKGAYLTGGSLWLCLNLGSPSPANDYTHFAFSVSAQYLAELKASLSDVIEWQNNTSEGESWYILDPDGHQLELHVGNLSSRLDALRLYQYEGLKWL